MTAVNPADVHPVAPVEPLERSVRNSRSVVGRNIAVLLGSQAVTWSLALVLTIMVPRYLGPDGVGQLRLGAALWAFAVVIGELGTNMLVILEFAHDPALGFALVKPVLRLRLLGAFLGIVGVLTFVLLAGYDLETSVVVGIVGIGVLIGMMADVARGALFGFQWMTVTAQTDVIAKVVTVVVVVGVLIAGGDTVAVAVAMIVPAVVSGVLLFRALRTKRDRVNAPHPSPPARAVLKRSSPFLYSSIVVAGYSSLDVVIISLVATETEVGWYAVAATLMGTLLFLPNTIVTSLFPALAQVHEENAGAASELLARALRTTMIFAFPISVGIMVVAGPLVTLLFGSDFTPAGAVLAAGGIVLLLMFPTILIGGIARATGRVRVFNVAITLATIMTIPLDLVLVPWTRDRFDNGAIGGALSYIITELLVLIVLIWKVAPILTHRRTVVRVLKCLLASAAIFLAWPLRNEFILVPVAVGSIAYFAMVLLLRIPDAEERHMAHRLWMRIRSGGRARPEPSMTSEATP